MVSTRFSSCWYANIFGTLKTDKCKGIQVYQDIYLPSLCPSPEKAFTVSLGFTYSSVLWSSMFRLTTPPFAILLNSSGTSLKKYQ